MQLIVSEISMSFRMSSQEERQIDLERHADVVDLTQDYEPTPEELEAAAPPSPSQPEPVFPDDAESEAAYHKFIADKRKAENLAQAQENKRLFAEIEEVDTRRKAQAAAEAPETGGYWEYDLSEEPYVHDHDLQPDPDAFDTDSTFGATAATVDPAEEEEGIYYERDDGEIVGSSTGRNTNSKRRKAAKTVDDRQRCWVCTIYEFDKYPERRARIEELAKYAIFGKETCPTTGRVHLQGFFYSHEKHSQQAMRNKCRTKEGSFWVAESSDFATIEEAIVYCKKGGEWTETGIKPAEPGRAKAQKLNWAAQLTLARQGPTAWDKVDARVQFLHQDKLERHYNIECAKNLKLLDSFDNWWFYGGAGSGKSKTAWDTYSPDLYVKGPNKWFDHYMGQATVLVEDLDVRDREDVRSLKIWADKYPFQAEMKGSMRLIRPRRIVVTSNYHPRDIWGNHQDLEPIMRRFKVRKYEVNDGVYSFTDE